MTSYQFQFYIFLMFLLIRIAVPPPPTKKNFRFFMGGSPIKKQFLWGDDNGNKAMQHFCVIPAIAPCIFFYFLFYIIVQFLIKNLFRKAMQVFHLLSSFL